MRPMNFGDGFRFGCGFFLAIAIAYTVVLVIVVLTTLITGASILPAILPRY